MLRSILQNSTAGFYVFASDSTTPATGKTGLTLTVTLSKAGGTANAVSPTITEIGNGLYWIAPIAAHRDTLGEIAWQFSASGAIISPRLEKVVAVNDQVAAFGANTTAPATPTNVTDARDALLAKLPESGRALSDEDYTAPDNAGINAIGTLVSNLNDLSAAEVNAQVVDALSVDTYAEISSPPAATSSLKDKITWIFQWLRNKSTQTATQRKLYADDGTTVISTETVSDDGTTYTKGEQS